MQSKEVDSERQRHTQTTRTNCLSRSTILHRCYTKRNFQTNHIHRSVICSSHWAQILPLPHFYIPQNVNPQNKTPPRKTRTHEGNTRQTNMRMRLI